MLSQIDFINGETRKSLLKLFMPLIAAMTLTMAYSLVDSLWVGNLLGQEGMSALTASTAIVLFLNSISMGAGNGVTVMIAGLAGAGDKAKIRGAAATIMTVSLVVALAVSVFGELTARPLLMLMDTPASVLADAVSYLQLYLTGNIALFLYMQFTSIFRAFGDSAFQMKGMFMTVIVNAVLDPVLIHFLGFDGVAIATVISEMMCLIYAAFYYKGRRFFVFNFHAITLQDAKTMCSLCIPTTVQAVMPAISSAIMIALVNPYGVVALAGYGVVRNLELIMFMPTTAMAMAVTTITGYCHGAQRFDRAADYLKESLLVGGILIAGLSAVVIAGCGTLSACFGQPGEVIAITTSFMHIVSVGYLLYMITCCMQGFFTGMGRPGLAMLLLIFYYLIARIPAALLMEMRFGLDGIWMGFLASHILACAAAVIGCRFFFLPRFRGDPMVY